MSPRVDLQTVRVFLALTEELHFTRTAERVGLTTSRVSQILRDLERHLGTALFERTSRRVTLTPVGRALRDELAPAYATIENALAATREHAGGVAGELRVGSYHLANFGPRFAEATEELAATHPRASVRMIDIGRRRNPLDDLRDRTVDALAMNVPLSDPDLVVGPVLSREDRVLVVAREHVLATRTSVSYEDVADHPVVEHDHLPREVLDGLVPRRTPSGRPIVHERIESFFDGLELLRTGRAVLPTVVPFVEWTGPTGLVAVPIRDLPPAQTALVWLVDHQPAVLLALAELLEQKTPVG